MASDLLSPSAAAHKEFVLVDLSRYQEGKVGMRWRTEAEVLSGKGEFACCAFGCDSITGLHSYETPFAYADSSGARRAALVKARVCAPCAAKLFFKPLAEQRAAAEAQAGGRRHRRRRRSRSRDSREGKPRRRSRSRSRDSGGGKDEDHPRRHSRSGRRRSHDGGAK